MTRKCTAPVMRGRAGNNRETACGHKKSDHWGSKCKTCAYVGNSGSAHRFTDAEPARAAGDTGGGDD